MTCEEFQAQLPELMNENIHDHEHLRTCDRCSALLAELEDIADAARLLLVPSFEPSDKILEGLRRRLADETTGAVGEESLPTA